MPLVTWLLLGVFKGVMNVAVTDLASLPVDGKSGPWGLTCTGKGFITADTFVLILQDLVNYLEKEPREAQQDLEGHYNLIGSIYQVLGGLSTYNFSCHVSYKATLKQLQLL